MFDSWEKIDIVALFSKHVSGKDSKEFTVSLKLISLLSLKILNIFNPWLKIAAAFFPF